MQFTTRNSDQIRAGGVTLTFRNWKRPHAKVGGVYRLRPNGAVEVTGLANVRLAEVSTDDAVRAGFPSVDDMVAFLGLPRTAEVTRVEFALTDDSPKAVPSLTVEEVVKRLEATDRRSAAPWTARVLALIEAHPAIRAGDLAPLTCWDTPKFKANVRKLKALGLTRSLEVGYRLTDLGVQVQIARASATQRTA
ncbi:MAG: hypothetical protein F4X98_19680 [Gammaproteobacteria bacterium]|nr:hypothetical protein [Gammaproteobacteria bacterium]